MWFYKNEPLNEIPEGYFGFVYCIINKMNDKKYIGEKQFYTFKYYQKNKKRKKKRVESDWRDYTGSNAILNEDISNNDDKLHKEVLHLCKTKSEMSYIETLYILKEGALLRDDYYNDWVSCKITRRHLLNNKTIINEVIS